MNVSISRTIVYNAKMVWHKSRILVFLYVYISIYHSVFSLTVVLENDGPIVRGGTINLSATVQNSDGSVAEGTFNYYWEDDAIPRHTKENDDLNATDTWTISYNASLIEPGFYVVRVQVCHHWYLGICSKLPTVGTYFEITDTLNGQLQLLQKNETRDTMYVSSSDPTVHNIKLKKSDENYIAQAPTVSTYWFVDCVYYGITNEMKFQFNYTKHDETHIVEALVVADFTPLQPTTTVPPSTTTTKSTTTTTRTTTKTTTTPTTTTIKPNVTSSTIANVPNKISVPSTVQVKNVSKRDVHAQNSTIMMNINGRLVLYNGTFPYICNNTWIPTDKNKIYGYFSRKIVVKDPISKVNVSGNNWLQQGNILDLTFKCTGSANIQYCTDIKKGIYNVTGNETCHSYETLDSCNLRFQRYFSNEHTTVILILKNDVSKVITPVAVTIYKVKTQAQLSVIMVPVIFTIIAIILMIFGIAYYVQHRSRFTVEVADFDFGHQYNHLEYKTFSERLKDSVMNAFTTAREPTPSNSEVPVWPPGHKYGSMT